MIYFGKYTQSEAYSKGLKIQGNVKLSSPAKAVLFIRTEQHNKPEFNP